MILETLVAASISTGPSEPKGFLPPNFLDVVPNPISRSIWSSAKGTYTTGNHQRLNRLGPPGNEGANYEGLRVSVGEYGVYFEKNNQEVQVQAEYLGSAFHQPYAGWCGTAGCNRGIGSHSFIYKLSEKIGDKTHLDPLKYIIIAFDTKEQRYSRIFLSSLTGREKSSNNRTYEFYLDDLERRNFRSTDYVRQEPNIPWIQTIPGRSVCRGIASGNAASAREAKRRNLSPADCGQPQISDKGQVKYEGTFPGKVAYAKITKPLAVQVFAHDFFRLKPIANSEGSRVPATYLDEANVDNKWVTHTGYYPQIENDGEAIAASVNGLKTHGDRLRVLFAGQNCNVARLHTTFTSLNGSSQFLAIKNEPIKVELSLTKASREPVNKGPIRNCDPYIDAKCSETLSSLEQIDAQLNYVTKFIAGYMAWIDLHLFNVGDLKRALSEKYQISIKIPKNQELKILRNLENSWSLNGLANALDRAKTACIIKNSFEKQK